MMCVFPVIDICDSKNALIFKIRIFSDRKVNVVGDALGRSKLKISSGFLKLGEKSILFYGVTQKLISVVTWNFYKNCMLTFSVYGNIFEIF